MQQVVPRDRQDMKRASCFEIAEATFKKIQALLPEISMTLDYEDKHVELIMVIPKQDGLNFTIYVCLQNDDELHLFAERIWCEYWPADSESVVDNFTQSVLGLIRGDFRIRLFVRKGKVRKAYLQRKQNEEWVTVYRDYRSFHLPWLRAEEIVVQNTWPPTK